MVHFAVAWQVLVAAGVVSVVSVVLEEVWGKRVANMVFWPCVAVIGIIAASQNWIVI